jgi:hypothetical protein
MKKYMTYEIWPILSPRHLVREERRRLRVWHRSQARRTAPPLHKPITATMSYCQHALKLYLGINSQTMRQKVLSGIETRNIDWCVWACRPKGRRPTGHILLGPMKDQSTLSQAGPLSTICTDFPFLFSEFSRMLRHILIRFFTLHTCTLI